MPLSDTEIEEQVLIHPFVHGQTREGISYGLSSYGYDLRLAYNLKIFTNVYSSVIDPKAINARSFVDVTAEYYFDIPPNSFALGHSVEKVTVPRNVLAICVGKSTYARCGILTNVTPLEPEWEGQVTIEISNTAPLPARVYVGEGICQIIFLRAEQECKISYADKKGKYQDQKGIVLPKVTSRSRAK